MLGIVYVVDDEPKVRNGIVDLLSMMDVETEAFDSTESFLEAIVVDSESKRCVIADLRMPGLSGLDLRTELMKRECDIPVILLTGYRDDETEERAKQLGIYAVLDKPLPVRELMAMVQDALAS